MNERANVMRLLAVDDDPIILELLDEIIRATSDHELLTASSAEEAIEVLGQHSGSMVDCFLLDIEMPGMNGIELCQALRATEEFRTTPVVMLTGRGEKEYIDCAFAAGANDYLTKPFEVSEINRRLEATRLRADQLTALSTSELLAEVPTEIGLFEPIKIFDVDNVVDYFSLENYLPSLPRQSLFGAVCMGIQVRRVQEIHEMVSGYNFLGLIEDVAETISDALRNYECLIAYAGNGTFVVVFDSKGMPKTSALTDQMNLMLQKKGTDAIFAAGRKIRLICGDFVRVMSNNSERVQDSLIRAQSSADKAATEREHNLDKFWFMGQVAQ